MPEGDLVRLVGVSIGLGLLGFVEPCSIGATLLFIKSLEGREGSRKLLQVGMFAVVRALFMGALGLAAIVLGAAFLGFQKAAWIAFGAVYLLIGILYVVGKSGAVARSLGPGLSRLSSVKGSAAFGALFALNIPACAAPLLLVLLGMAAAGGSGGASPAAGFASLALFGFALSLPIIAAALFPRTQAALDWLAGLSRRMPFWTGVLLIVLGVWSVRFGLFVPLPGAAP
jgi:cytochrome c-type biogenesis protein